MRKKVELLVGVFGFMELVFFVILFRVFGIFFDKEFFESICYDFIDFWFYDLFFFLIWDVDLILEEF